MSIADPTNFIIQQGSSRWRFNALLHTSEKISTGDTGIKLVLENNGIIAFEYSNEMNKLYLTGSLTYSDNYGEVDKALNHQYLYCSVSIAELEHYKDADFSIDREKPGLKFEHVFFVAGVEILNRNNNIITYKFKLVSSNWLSLISTVSFTNYNKSPEKIFDIIKQILTKTTLKVDSKSFGEVTTDVKIKYISQENDNVMTCVDYLMNKLFYYETREKQMKFIYYNETRDQYALWDITKANLLKNSRTIMLSFFKSKTETYQNSNPVKMASVSKFPKTETFQTQFDYSLFAYDYSKNEFKDQTIKSKEIITLQKPRIQLGKQSDKFIQMEKIHIDKFGEVKYQNAGSYWNNNIKIYDNFVRSYLEDNSLVLNTDGQLLIQPCSAIVISIDRSTPTNSEDSAKDAKQMKNRYISLEGTWFAFKVRHIFSPVNQSYTQNLVLCRNFKNLGE